MRLAILATHPVQYFAPVFRELTQIPGLDVKVFFGCDHGTRPSVDPTFKATFQWDCQPTAGFDHVFISNVPLRQLKGLSGIRLAFKAYRQIEAFQPTHVLVFGYMPSFIMSSTLLLGRHARRPMLLRAETTDVAKSRGSLKAWLRDAWLVRYYRRFQAVFPIGTYSEEHYRRLGVPPEQLFSALYAIDVDYFQHQVNKFCPQRNTLRAEWGIPDSDHVLLYCGKIFPPKNPLLIPRAIASLTYAERARLWFVAVGDGELRQPLEHEMTNLLGDRARFVGFKNQSELGRYYAMADTLVLPSRSGETWGLVVNEALQFGLRVIVSDKVGSSCDLVRNEQTGWIVPSDDPASMAHAVAAALAAPAPSGESRPLPHPRMLAEATAAAMRSLSETPSILAPTCQSLR